MNVDAFIAAPQVAVTLQITSFDDDDLTVRSPARPTHPPACPPVRQPVLPLARRHAPPRFPRRIRPENDGRRRRDATGVDGGCGNLKGIVEGAGMTGRKW